MTRLSRRGTLALGKEQRIVCTKVSGMAQRVLLPLQPREGLACILHRKLWKGDPLLMHACHHASAYRLLATS